VGKPCPRSRDVAKPVDSHENVDMAYMASMVTANTGRDYKKIIILMSDVR